ncbi:lipase [Nocardioides sp. TRM66260-LWL]|uniref:esterase/lipase family protein n=1 Tax=Nocardioides sp. TRM66260-LWL TaxID=2874478 RepID=UPI001CC6BD56|nr:lipase [Nocardioides sp. TRM66260-LWL]MBZ5735202.1 lipase [Nocardioides sp. TRM66260-LWL]
MNSRAPRSRRPRPARGLSARLGGMLTSGVLAAGGLLAVGAVVPASAAPAPVGPAFSVPTATLDAAVTCRGDLAGSALTPVLLVPGTTLTPELNFSWNYVRAFDAQDRPWCTVELPANGMLDIATAGEYVTRAIRTIYAKAGERRIDVLGFSQGGMVPRWSLKYWPDTREMVDDLVSLDASNHGTASAYPVCLLGCAPSVWQQRSTSRFLAALNSGPETWPGISYTQVYTATDEVVFPNFDPVASSPLRTGQGQIRNVQVQSLCPVHVSEHLSMGTTDPVGYALALDALDHPGTADPARIPASVCLQLLHPGVDPVTYLPYMTQVIATAGQQLVLGPRVFSEPALPAYARG